MRLLPLTKNLPKPLIKIGQKPVIEHQIILLKKYGLKDVWILSGYLGEKIEEYLKDGRKWGIKLHYLQEEEPLGTAGALKQLEGKIKNDFLVFSGDVMMNFDVKRFISWHRQKKDSFASFIVHSNDHPFSSDLVEVDFENRVVSLLSRPHPPERIFRNLSIASVFIFSPGIFKYIPAGKKTDFEKDILPLVLTAKEKAYAYSSPEYFRDIGSLERLEAVRKDYLSEKIKKFSLKNKRPAIFLDRDGVINEEVDQLCRIEDLSVYDFAGPAIKKINEAGYLTILATNQPMLAKGFMTEKELNEIHKKLETELGRQGAKIDAIYYCPHHPENGFPGEIPGLKIRCNCRKPATGLIQQAAKDFNLDFKNSCLIGDSSIDAKTAENAKIKFIGVKTGYACKDDKIPVSRNFPRCQNLLFAVNYFLNHQGKI